MNLESKHLSPTTSLANLFDGYLFMSIFPFVTRTPRLRNQARAQHKGASRPSCRCANSRRVEGRRLGLTYIFTSRSCGGLKEDPKSKFTFVMFCCSDGLVEWVCQAQASKISHGFPIFHLPRSRARSSRCLCTIGLGRIIHRRSLLHAAGCSHT